MKKVSLFLVEIILSVCAINPSTYGQTSSSFNKEAFAKSVATASNEDKLALESIKSINARMYKDFSSKFKNATDIHTNAVDNSTVISCNADGKFSRILYDRKGHWQHTISSYDNEKLPLNVREVIEDVYPRYEIFGAAVEVTVGDGTAYLVTIENKTSWKRIKVVNGETEVYEEYEKR
jgi:hypothetical protein